MDSFHWIAVAVSMILGIGVTRLLGAAIEQNHDERGIIWPVSMAPFAVVICPIGYDRSADVKAAADRLHDELAAAGVDVLLDDRGERPGAMFADWELIGVPHRITIGDRGLKEGQVEYQHRRDTASTRIAVADVAGWLRSRRSTFHTPEHAHGFEGLPLGALDVGRC